MSVLRHAVRAPGSAQPAPSSSSAKAAAPGSPLGPLHASADVLAELECAWARSDAILACVPPGALSDRPISLRHPWIFYVGHLPAFAWNQLCRGVLGREPFRAEFDQLFEFGIDPDEDGDVPGPQGNGGTGSWPPLAEVIAYRDRVRASIRGARPDVRARARDHVLAAGERIFHLVLEHELMHHETLLYMLHAANGDRRRLPAGLAAPEPGPAMAARPIEIPAGEVRMGVEPCAIPFAWDNELPARTEHVRGFVLDSLPVTLERFLEFVEAGGYGRRDLWSPRGWAFRERHDLRAPRDWIETEPGTAVRTLFGAVPIGKARGWPACVSWAEADAYARFRDARLPTETELARAAYGTPSGEERPYPWGDEPPDARHGGLDFRRFGPVPVGSHPAAASAFGVHELVGNGWEWTSTLFEAHPGFESSIPGYEGYSRDFFDGDHYAIFGGSWATDRRLLRRSFRNWYRYNYPYPFTKFRLAHPA